MDARYHDGLSARTWRISLDVVDTCLTFVVDGVGKAWPIATIDAESLGREVRLSSPAFDPARIVIPAADWRTIAGDAAQGQSQRRGVLLVLGLTALGASLAASLFIGVPAASGPLARHTPTAFERHIGDNFDAQISLAMPTCQGGAGQAALAQFGERLRQVTTTPFDIRVRAVEAPIANAFALPGGIVVVTDDLIDMTQSPDELSAVIAHEAAHVEKRHVMQAVWRQLGLGLVLDALVGGGSGAGQQLVLLSGSLSNLRYSRTAEAEADVRGQALLQAAGLSSQGMAPFFRRLSGKGLGPDAERFAALLSTHPESLQRARLSQVRARPGKTAFDPQQWAAIKSACTARDHRLLNPRRSLQPGLADDQMNASAG